MDMQFTEKDKTKINEILTTSGKDQSLIELKLYLSRYASELKSEGIDFTNVAYSIWSEYVSSRP